MGTHLSSSLISLRDYSIPQSHLSTREDIKIRPGRQAMEVRVYVTSLYKCNLYFKSVYQLQEARSTKAFGRLDRRLKVPSEALVSSKKIHFLFPRPHRESNPMIQCFQLIDQSIGQVWPLSGADIVLCLMGQHNTLPYLNKEWPFKLDPGGRLFIQ